MERLAEGVYVETGYPGTNVGAIQTKRGLVCIDTPSYPRDARDWLARLRQFDDRPIRYVVLTDAHGDRVLHARWFSAPVIAHVDAAARLEAWDRRFPQAVLDSLIAREPCAGRDLVQGPIEQATVAFTDELTIYNYDSPIQLLCAPGAGEGGVIVFLRRNGIVFTGDLLVAGTPPILAGAVTSAWLRSLAFLEQLAAQGAILVPGRGSLADEHDICVLQEFLLQARDYLAQRIHSGRKRAKMNAGVRLLLERYPLSQLPQEWVQKQYRTGLERIAEELRQNAHAAADAVA